MTKRNQKKLLKAFTIIVVISMIVSIFAPLAYVL
jgi:hypothetical protein